MFEVLCLPVQNDSTNWRICPNVINDSAFEVETVHAAEKCAHGASYDPFVGCLHSKHRAVPYCCQLQIGAFGRCAVVPADFDFKTESPSGDKMVGGGGHFDSAHCSDVFLFRPEQLAAEWDLLRVYRVVRLEAEQ